MHISMLGFKMWFSSSYPKDILERGRWQSSGRLYMEASKEADGTMIMLTKCSSTSVLCGAQQNRACIGIVTIPAMHFSYATLMTASYSGWKQQ